MSGVLAAIFHLFRRWPYATACVIVTLLLGACAAFLGLSELPHRRASERVSSDERLTMEGKLAIRKKLKEEFAEISEKVGQIEANLVEEGNLADNLVYFYTLEERTKARLPELHQVSSPTTDKSTYYRRVPYGLRVAGSYDQVAGFLVGLETGKRLAKVASFNLARTDPTGRTVALDLNVELLGRK